MTTGYIIYIPSAVLPPASPHLVAVLVCDGVRVGVPVWLRVLVAELVGVDVRVALCGTQTGSAPEMEQSTGLAVSVDGEAPLKMT